LPDGAAAPLPEPNAGEVPEPVNAAVPELAQKAAEQIEQAGMEALIQPPAVEPAEKTVDHPIESPAVVEPAEEKAGEGADTTPAGPPDRTLELAGLQALMKNHETRLQIQNQNAVAKAKQQAEGSPKGPAPTEVNWSSHKKEGMRLKRLMEESSEGAKFPHMQKLWGGSAAVTWLVLAPFFYPINLPKTMLLFETWDAPVFASSCKQIRTESSSCSNGLHPIRMPSQSKLTWCSPSTAPISTSRRGSSSRPRRCRSATSRLKKSGRLSPGETGCQTRTARGLHL